jgi:lipid II:glycine glycyltransferase (peptidoglycan interpeptide bridge formation enzyme)
MHIQEIHDQRIWNQFLLTQNHNTFLHSPAWIRFNSLQNHQSWQFGLYEADTLISIALVLKYITKRGTFLVIPHGVQDVRGGTGTLLGWAPFLKKLAHKEGASFVRIQPIVSNTTQNQTLFTEAGFKIAPLHLHTEYSTLLDITPETEKILMGMRKTTRQMCKKGEKLVLEGRVEIIEYDSVSNDLYEIYTSTFQRGNFVPYSQQYLQDEYSSFKSSGNVNQVRLFAIKHEGKILSWAMILVSGKRAFYHQGANILSKEIPASYLAQWTGIKWAQVQGCESYDFWGVSPAGVENHPWKNISLFKRGFGGEDVDLLHAQDLRVSLKYWFTWAIDTYRAKKRGF